MPFGGQEPDPGMPRDVFDALHAMSYDRANGAFSSGGRLYCLYPKKSARDEDSVEWVHDTEDQSKSYPRAVIPQFTYDVIHQGQWQPGGGVLYQGNVHRIRFVREDDALIAKAVDDSRKKAR